MRRADTIRGGGPRGLAALALGLAAGIGLSLFRPRRSPPAAQRPGSGQADTVLLRASAEAFDRVLIRIDAAEPMLVAGAPMLERCRVLLGSVEADPGSVLEVLARRSPDLGAAMTALAETGAPFDALVMIDAESLRVSGRCAGGLALVILEPGPPGPAPTPTSPTAEPFLVDALEAYPWPACVAAADGRLLATNRAWTAEAETGDLGVGPLVAEVLGGGVPSERIRWRGGSGRRRAMRLLAAPLTGGGAVVWTWDVTAAEGAADTLARQSAAQSLILAQVADAVAVFDSDDRLVFHNAAFARLWDLEPAWLAEGPTHGAILDRLRRHRRLPEVADFARFRAEELARRQRLEPAPEAVWRIAGDRTLRVLSLPHPGGGLVRLFSDITPEIRLKSQWNQLIQVRQATLDKLNDAVAVFGGDARLKLHNEAFQRLWGLPDEALGSEPAFDDLAERCMILVHDGRFWAELKGRIGDPDPGVRAAAEGELRTGDGRRLAWQSRPLPDGATLVSFVDVSDARRVEDALADREAALRAAEQLGRDFVSSVSYELRTPLTTILGYSELLESGETGLSDRGRGRVAAVRAAAATLAATVEDILAFAELDAGEMSLDLALLNVRDLLADAEARARDRAAAAGVALAVAGEAAGTVRADRARLARSLDHLVDHALRQTPAGGRITLSGRRASGEVCLEVADNGRGVPFHVQAHVFDRFSGDEGAGAGFGLALVKAIVERHGGWVALESAPGVGAVFTCHLPEAGQAPADGAALSR